MMRVAVLIPCRDGADTLPAVINSLFAQTISVEIVVADDASIDTTPNIISEYGIRSIRWSRRESVNYHRVPALINLASTITPTSDYYMISGDDNCYPPNYVECILTAMKQDGVDIASGHNPREKLHTPTGSGRILSSRLWRAVIPLPHHCAWEPWMLCYAKCLRMKSKVYPVHKYPMTRRNRVFSFGYGSHIMGTPFIYTLGRAIWMASRRQLTRGLTLFLGHLEYAFRRFPQSELATCYRQQCLVRIHRTLRRR